LCTQPTFLLYRFLQLSVFENNNSDFIVPIDLYVSRLRQLEVAVTNSSRGISVEAYFAGEEEDAEFTAYTGSALAFTEDPDNGQEQSHPSLSGSGYSSVRVVWEDNDEYSLSPWEISVKDAAPPERPHLSDNEKKIIRRALDIVKSLPNVCVFRQPVNEQRYSDYQTRVEVPMDLTFITNRLETDYYSTKFSVVADMRLIQTNCAKYNGDHDDLTELAAQLVATFEENVFDDTEQAFFHQCDAPTSGSLEALENNVNDATATGSSRPSASAVVRQRPQRQRRPPRSVLEDFPGGTEESRATRSTRIGRTIRPASRRGRSRLQESDNSVLIAVAQPEVAPTLEQLSNGRARGRATRARQNNEREATQGRNLPQRSARAGLRNSNYRDLPSDIDEEADESPQASPRRTSRRNNSTSHRSLRAGLRNSDAQQPFSSSDEDEDELNMQPQARTSSSRTTRGSPAQEPPRGTRIRIRTRREPEPADEADDESAVESSDDGAGSSPPQRGASRRSTRRSPTRGSRRASPEIESPPPAGRTRNRSKRRRSNDNDDESVDEERGADESDFEGSNGNEDSSGDDDDLSAVASSDSESEIVKTRNSRTLTSRQRAIKKEDESSVGSVPSRKTRSRNRHLEAPESPFRSSHARTTQRKSTSYADPSESEFESDADSPKSTARRPTQRKTNKVSKKRKGLSVSFVFHFYALLIHLLTFSFQIVQRIHRVLPARRLLLLARDKRLRRLG